MNTTYEQTQAPRTGAASKMASALIRPAWTPVTIAMMIIGFMIFWPLGLAMIAYILWGDRLEEFKSGVNRTTDAFACNWGKRAGMSNRTGNIAFDEWRDAEIARLEEERRRLDETRREFDDYLRELRRAKDEEEFNSFMASRDGKPAGKKGRKPVPKV